MDVDAVLSAEPVIQQVSWTEDDVILYHLGLGAGVPATDPAQLQLTYERDLKVLPTFAVIPTIGVMSAAAELPGLVYDPEQMLHGSQELESFIPLPAAGSATASARVAAVYDKGANAIAMLEASLAAPDGRIYSVVRSQLVLRGAGGFAGDRGPSASRQLPERQPDEIINVGTLEQQALLYRLAGDKNPLHADPEVAGRAGFERPILHGLCTWGIACRVIVARFLDGDVDAIGTYSARFAGTVVPGDQLALRVWESEAGFELEADVIGGGRALALGSLTRWTRR